MGLEAANNIGELNPAWPLGSDPKSEGDNHIRLIKSILQASWPIGKIWKSTIDENPFLHLGFGTWDVLAPGLMLIGSGDNGDGNDRVGGDEGGEATVVLVPGNIPAHDHGSCTLTYGLSTVDRASSGGGTQYVNNTGNDVTNNVNGRTGSQGSDSPHENMPPFRVIFQWERTA